jgi:signal transduction histidine kinase
VIPHANLEHHLQALNLLAAVFGALLVAAAIVAIRQIRLLEHAHQHTEQLNQTLTELKKAQSQLIQTEKMSSLGQMVAGIAHEINNPINFINGNITHASDYVQELLDLVELYQSHYPNPTDEIQAQIQAIDLDFLTEDLVKLLSSMKVGADRIREIVLSLRNFSRLDEADMKPIDIHAGIDSTLLILQNRLKETPTHPGIRVVKEYGDLPLIECYAGQLNQVFMNILSNAIDILEENFELKVKETGLGRKPAAQTTLSEKPDLTASESAPVPTITIRTQLEEEGHVVIRIADNGPGMTEEIRNRLFDPFFTTKPVGKGTGLGLSISYQIVVDKHGGSLKCFSEPGQGAEFWIEIPICQNQPDPPAILVEPKPEKMLVP